MRRRRSKIWLAVIVVPSCLIPAAILGLYLYVSATATLLHPNPQDVPAVTRSAPSPEWAGAVEQGRQAVRAALTEQNLPGLSVAVGAGGDIVWAEGFGWADLENRVHVGPDTRFRIGTASTALTSAAAGLLLEKGRLKLDDEIQTYVPAFPGETVAGDRSPVDGAPRRRQERRRRRGAVVLDAVRAAGRRRCRTLRSVRCCSSRAPQYRYSSYGWILVSAAVEAAADEPFLTFMRNQIFEPLGMDEHEGRLLHGGERGPGDVLFPEVRRRSPLRPGPDAPARLFLLRGIQRLRVDTVRPGALRPGHQPRQAAATRHRPTAPGVTATALGGGNGLRSRLGPRDGCAGG